MFDVHRALVEARADEEHAREVFDRTLAEERELNARQHKARWELVRLEKLVEALQDIAKNDRIAEEDK